jgi:hypothetical protein
MIMIMNVLSLTFEQGGAIAGNNVARHIVGKFPVPKTVVEIAGAYGAGIGSDIGKKLDNVDFEKHVNNAHKFNTEQYKNDIKLFTKENINEMQIRDQIRVINNMNNIFDRY